MADTGNPYDQFLGGGASAPPPQPPGAPSKPRTLSDLITGGAQPAPGPNPYDQFVNPATKPGETTPSLGSVYRADMSAINNDIAHFAGFPVDALGWLVNRIPGVSLDTDKQIGSTASIKRGLNYLGIDTDIAPQNEWERATAAAASAIPTTLSFLAGAGEARALPWIGEKIAPYVERLLPKTGRELGTLAGAATAGGATGEVAREAVPEEYQETVGPLVDVLGNIAGGSAVAGADAGLSALMRQARDLAGRFLRPLTESGRQTAAGEFLKGSATNPEELAGKLDVENPEMVPGSKPTTFQLSGDPGIGIAERGAAARDPAAFLERRAEQNRARVGAIEGSAPSEAQPGAVGDFFRRQLADIDAAGASRETAAREAVDTAAEGMGGQAFATPQEYGQTIRGNLADLNAAAKARESALWNAIPKDLAVRGEPLAQAARGIQAAVDPLGTPMVGTEARIFGNATGLDGNVSFDSLRAMRSDVTTAIRERISQVRSSEDPVVRRLTQLKGAIDDALSGTLDSAAAHEDEMVRLGALDPDATFAANLQRQAAAFMSNRNVGTVAASPVIGGAGRVTGAGGRAPGDAGVHGAESAPGGGSGASPGAAGVPGETPPAAPDQAALDAYAAARQATLERKQTFRAGPVGQALAQGSNGAPFRLPESQVPAQFWRPGPRGSEGVQAYLKAGGDPATLADYAAFDLRRTAMRPDGTLDAGRYNAWVKRFDAALSEQPELRARFQTVADAQSALEQAAAARKASTDALQQSAAKHFLGADPDVAVGRAFGSANPDQTFADLVRLTSADPAASQGLKRAVVDYILRHFQGYAEAGDTGINLLKPEMYQAFIDRQAAPLKRLFGEDGYANLKAVADDLRRTNRSVTGTKLPGGSNTAQDTVAVGRATEGEDSLLQNIVATAVGMGTTAVAGPAAGVGAAYGSKVLGGFRAANIRKINDLVTEALLNPALARTLLAKVPKNPPPYLLDRLARQLTALTAESTARAEGQPQQRARGGAVRAVA